MINDYVDKSSFTKLDFGKFFEFDFFGFVHEVTDKIGFEEEVGKVVADAKGYTEK